MKYPVWYDDNHNKVTCIEKIKVMEEGLDELTIIAQDLFEDGVLMGISRKQLKAALLDIIQNLKCDF